MSTLPKPPLQPQLARSAKKLPTGDGWGYEPKYDGFRALVFGAVGKEPKEPYVQSRGGKPLGRYFPELELPPGDYVLDGELVILDGDGAEVFDALQNRIHPAQSRIERLAAETPVRYRVFDLLARDGRSLTEAPFAERRAALAELVAEAPGAVEEGPGGWTAGSVELTPLTLDPDAAAPWLEGGEGVIAKRLDAPYVPGKRTSMVKVKRLRTIDAVVAGWRPGKEPDTVGSLMLGLYDGDELRVVGHTSGLKAAE
jgi:ATP-dependent DNA ligase